MIFRSSIIDGEAGDLTILGVSWNKGHFENNQVDMTYSITVIKIDNNYGLKVRASYNFIDPDTERVIKQFRNEIIAIDLSSKLTDLPENKVIEIFDNCVEIVEGWRLFEIRSTYEYY